MYCMPTNQNKDMFCFEIEIRQELALAWQWMRSNKSQSHASRALIIDNCKPFLLVLCYLLTPCDEVQPHIRWTEILVRAFCQPFWIFHHVQIWLQSHWTMSYKQNSKVYHIDFKPEPIAVLNLYCIQQSLFCILHVYYKRSNLIKQQWTLCVFVF